MTEDNNPNPAPEVDAIEALGADATPAQVLETLGIEAPGGETTPADGGGESGAEGDAAGERSVEGRPDWLLPKYATVEDQAKAMVDAQKLIGKPKVADEPPTDLKLPEQGEKPTEGERRALDGDYINELGVEWYNNKGVLTPETMEKLKTDTGMSEDVINDVMGSQAEKNATADAGIMVTAGITTQEQWTEIAQWGADNLSEAEYADISELLADPRPGRRGAAVQSLKARYDMGRGPVPTERLAGTATGNPSLTPITSQAELHAAMDDPRYYEDSPKGDAYRKEVNGRVAV